MKNMKLYVLTISIYFTFRIITPIYALEPDDSNPALTKETESPADINRIFSFKGQFKNLYTQTKTDAFSETSNEKKLVANLTRLRLSPELNLSDVLLIHIDYDNELIAGNYLKSREFDSMWRTSNYNDFFHLARESYYSEDLYYRTKVHRAYAKIVTGNLTTTIGRQQIRFGSGRLWNPLDILNPIEPTSIEGAEEQKGTDALRLEYYPTEKTEIGLIADGKRVDDSGRISDLSLKNCNIIGRVKTTIGETEVAALGGKMSQRKVGGADVSTILHDGTLRGSLLYSHPDEDTAYYIAGAGYEYNFAMGLYFLIEYFYNQIGLNYNKRLNDAYLERQIMGINEKNYRELANQFFTYNQHYSGMALGYDITALIRGEVFAIYDFQGRGILFNPSVKYNAFQNIDVMTGIMMGHVLDGASNTSDFEIFAENSLFYASLVWFF